MSSVHNYMLTQPRLVVASLIPFKNYIELRYTGKSRVVKYDGKKISMRGSLLPRPKKPMKIRYSRVALRKRGISMRKLREIAREFLASLPAERSAYRLLLRLSKLRKRGLRYYIDALRSSIARSLGIITPKYIAKLLQAYGAESFEIVKKGRLRGFLRSIKSFFLRKKPIATVEVGSYVILLYR